METRSDPSGDYVFGWTGRSELDTITDAVTGETIDYDWTVASEVDIVTYPTSGLTRDYNWNDRGLLESDTLRDSSLATVASFTYGYDSDGNVKTETVVLPGNAEAGDHSYGYDDSGRLTSWTHDGVTVNYSWDGAGNRISAGTDSYTYDARNRLTSGPEGDYTYSPRGDLETITDGGTTVTYGFDPLGRMVDYNGQAAFTYDGLDRVAARNGTAFSYIGTMLDAVDDGTFTYGRSPGGRLISQTDGTTDLLVGLDRHGDLTWLADPATGALTDTVMFDPFGDQTATTGSTDPTVGFQGDYTDPASEEVWMGARWYSGTDAVFRSRDTIFGELRTPVSLNRYTYGWANPLTYFDPDGHWVTESNEGFYNNQGRAGNANSGKKTSGSSSSSGSYTNPADQQAVGQTYEETNPTPTAAIGMTVESLLIALSEGWNPVLAIEGVTFEEWWAALDNGASCAPYVGGGMLVAPNGELYPVVANPWIDTDGWTIIASAGSFGTIDDLSFADVAVTILLGITGASSGGPMGPRVPAEYALSLDLNAHGIPGNPPDRPGVAVATNLDIPALTMTSTPGYPIVTRAGDFVLADFNTNAVTWDAAGSAVGNVTTGMQNYVDARASEYGVFYVTFEENEAGQTRATVSTFAVSNNGITTYIVPSNVFRDPNNNHDLDRVMQPPPVYSESTWALMTSGDGWATVYFGDR